MACKDTFDACDDPSEAETTTTAARKHLENLRLEPFFQHILNQAFERAQQNLFHVVADGLVDLAYVLFKLFLCRKFLVDILLMLCFQLRVVFGVRDCSRIEHLFQVGDLLVVSLLDVGQCACVSLLFCFFQFPLLKHNVHKAIGYP